jgi:hypothetical protein
MHRVFLITFLLLASFALASTQETLDQLKQRATAARPQDQPKLFLEVAERQIKAADDAYNQGNVDQGRAAVEDVAAYSEKAGAAAKNTHKHLKNTEIKIRDLAHKLDAMRRSLNFEDRQPVQAAIDRMEKVRTDLLAAMFGAKS